MSLPKPYYDQDGITIYHADCREILPHLPKVDLVLTDPPYGVAFGGKNTKYTTRNNKGYLSGDSEDIGPEVIKSVLNYQDTVIVFPGIRLLSKYPTSNDMGCIYCPSGAGVGPWGFVNFHPFLCYGRRSTAGSYPLSMSSFHTSDKCGHPCPKPVEWMQWCINLIPNAKEILDPFMGSGTTLVAAKRLHRQAIGIEIEERYCEIAVKRLGQGVLPI
jgi:DNA modification methylase